jgi:hypothetical protein
MVQFQFREQGSGTWLGNIDCLHSSEVFNALVEDEYRWALSSAPYQQRQLQRNYLASASVFSDLLASLSGLNPPQV